MQRFWGKVQKTNGCWIWTGAKKSQGYGAFRFDGRTVRAHRFSFELHNGAVPSGKEIGHSCDNRACVNPHHLFICTHAENMRDMRQKGRSLLGEKQHRHKLTEAEVMLIRSSPKTGRALARQFGVGEATISFIKSGQRWGYMLPG